MPPVHQAAFLSTKTLKYSTNFINGVVRQKVLCHIWVEVTRIKPASYNMDRTRVLCVEDDEVNAFIMEKLLGEVFDLTLVKNGESCLELAKNEAFDVVLMDINLGRGNQDGVYILQELRKIPLYENVPVFAITSYALPGDEEKFMDQGFDNYFSKPIDKERLFAEIRKHEDNDRS